MLDAPMPNYRLRLISTFGEIPEPGLGDENPNIVLR